MKTVKSKAISPQGRREETPSQLYSEILRRIVSGDYYSGQRLVEEELAQTFGVSRTPIREVLFKLERDGLVHRIPNQGAKVASFTPDDLERVYEIRKVLECLAIRSAAKNIKLSDLFEFERRLEELQGDKGVASNPQRFSQVAEIDLQLHEMIAHNSGNPRLISYLETLSQLVNSVRFLSNNKEEHAVKGIEEHLQIVRALKYRNEELAERLMGEHIDASKQRAIGFFPHPALSTAEK